MSNQQYFIKARAYGNINPYPSWKREFDYWLKDVSNNLYYTTANVGIGYATPLGNLVVAGNVGIGTNNPQTKLHVLGDVNCYNLTVNGTSTTVNSTNVTVNDTIISLASNTTSNDSKHRGVEMKWYDTQVRSGFMGIKDGDFIFYSDASNNNDILTNGVTANITPKTVIIDNPTESSGNPSFTWTNNTNTGIYKPSNNVIGFTTNGMEKMRIDGSGNVGIGTNNPQAKLDIRGNTSFTGNITSNGTIYMNDGTAAAPVVTFNSDTNTGIYRPASSTLGFVTGGSEKIRIDGSGNVGIGTSNPQTKLHINDTQGIIISSGTSGQRPLNPSIGCIRFNTDLGYGVLEYFSGISWISLGIKNGSSFINAAPSASYIKQITGTSTNGLYWIDIPIVGPIQVYCDMNTNGGGWMHCGTFSDNNENRGEIASTAQQSGGSHPWGAPLNATQNTGIWEDTSILGSQSFTSDFKNHIWNYFSMTQMLMKDQGNTLRNLFYTNSISSQTLSQFFTARTWGASASDNSQAAYTNNRVYGIGITNFGVVDPVLESGNKSIMLFKFGEVNGVQDANKDRCMISGHNWNAANGVDNPYGIGCMMSSTTNQYWRDIVPVSQNADMPPTNITGSPYNYTLWVR